MEDPAEEEERREERTVSTGTATTSEEEQQEVSTMMTTSMIDLAMIPGASRGRRLLPNPHPHPHGPRSRYRKPLPPTIPLHHPRGVPSRVLASSGRERLAAAAGGKTTVLPGTVRIPDTEAAQVRRGGGGAAGVVASPPLPSRMSLITIAMTTTTTLASIAAVVATATATAAVAGERIEGGLREVVLIVVEADGATRRVTET